MIDDQLASTAILALLWAYILWRVRRSIWRFISVQFAPRCLRAEISERLVRTGIDQDNLKKEVTLWLKQHCRAAWRFNYNKDVYWIDFVDAEDSTLFKLTWS